MSQEFLEFKNFNFKLAIIETLMYEKELLGPKFDVHEFAKENKIDIEKVGYYPISKVQKYFKKLQIPKELALEVEEIDMDGGNDVYMQIWPFWDGECDYFDIEELSAKELLQFPKLRRITGTANFFSAVDALLAKHGIENETAKEPEPEPEVKTFFSTENLAKRK